MELKNDFYLSPFDRLDSEQYAFLLAFLKNRGNLKEIQAEMHMTYIGAKKKLDELLAALNLSTNKTEERKCWEMTNLKVDYTSKLASEIIKRKLKENNGHVTVYTARGLPCEIYGGIDGKTFTSDKLPIKPPYEYTVFDAIVNLLIAQGGEARKGNGRNFKLGEAGCEENTVAGAVALTRGYGLGESIYDPVFVLAAVLEWAGIAENGRGKLILKKEYLATFNNG